jgi:hypothetical protein
MENTQVQQKNNLLVNIIDKMIEEGNHDVNTLNKFKSNLEKNKQDEAITKGFSIGDTELKTFLLEEFPDLQRYELEYTGELIDITNPSEGLVEWGIERFMEYNNLDYDTYLESLTKQGCKVLNIK